MRLNQGVMDRVDGVDADLMTDEEKRKLERDLARGNSALLKKETFVPATAPPTGETRSDVYKDLEKTYEGYLKRQLHFEKFLSDREGPLYKKFRDTVLRSVALEGSGRERLKAASLNAAGNAPGQLPEKSVDDPEYMGAGDLADLESVLDPPAKKRSRTAPAKRSISDFKKNKKVASPTAKRRRRDIFD